MSSGVRAVVVGVETYEAGDRWALDGPAPDAVQVVSWLLDGGVPREQITLLVSALRHNRAAVEALGIPIGTPTRSTVYDLFTRDIPAETGDELLVYWGGHGVLDDTHNRRLFCADATVADKRNVDFDALCRFLATAAIPSFPRQVFLVDACQVLASERRYANRLPADGWPEGPYRHGREQHSLFAASTGETADNSIEHRNAGLFTDSVLDDLRSHSTPPSGLDVGELAGRIDRKFTDLREAGLARQTPAYVWLKTPNREGTQVYGLPSSGRTRMPIAALREVVDAMLEADELVSTPSRERMIMAMPTEIRAAVNYSGTPREHVIAWVRTCERFATGRAALEGVLDLSMTDREALGRITGAFDRYWPLNGR
jgi:hypothetical protein